MWRAEGYWFYWYNLKADESKHLNTIYGNRKKKKKYCRELFQDHTKLSASLISSVSQLVKYIATYPCKIKNTFPPELHWGQGSNTKLLTQQFKCLQQMC